MLDFSDNVATFSLFEWENSNLKNNLEFNKKHLFVRRQFNRFRLIFRANGEKLGYPLFN